MKWTYKTQKKNWIMPRPLIVDGGCFDLALVGVKAGHLDTLGHLVNLDTYKYGN